MQTDLSICWVHMWICWFCCAAYQLVESHAPNSRVLLQVNHQTKVHIVLIFAATYELRYDKTNKMTVRPAKTQISLGICPVWSVFTVRMKKAWAFSYPLSAQRRLWSNWVDALADLSLCWAHMPFCWFCHEAAHILHAIHYIWDKEWKICYLASFWWVFSLECHVCQCSSPGCGFSGLLASGWILLLHWLYP